MLAVILGSVLMGCARTTSVELIVVRELRSGQTREISDPTAVHDFLSVIASGGEAVGGLLKPRFQIGYVAKLDGGHGSENVEVSVLRSDALYYVKSRSGGIRLVPAAKIQRFLPRDDGGVNLENPPSK